jgi:hypothetical protein
MHIRVGNKVQPHVIETALKVGESSTEDVLKVLGEPIGRGRALLPIDPAPRTLWTYYYEEGDTKQYDRMFLFVYFLQNRYDGYMWFSSLAEHLRDHTSASSSPSTGINSVQNP